MSEVKKLSVEGFMIIATVLMFAIGFLSILDGAIENPFRPNQITGMVSVDSSNAGSAGVGTGIIVVVGIVVIFEIIKIAIRAKKDNVQEHVKIRRISISAKGKK